MPRKPKKTLSPLDASPAKIGRGRPRKTVAPESLLPFDSSKGSKEKERECSPQTTDGPPSKIRTNPATGDRHYTSDEMEFMNAVTEFKRINRRVFPSCSEILGILRELGYEKVKE